MISLPEEINVASGWWYVVIDLANVSSSFFIMKEDQKVRASDMTPPFKEIGQLFGCKLTSLDPFYPRRDSHSPTPE